jgi:fructose-bisphosphate aldolase class I
MNAYNLKEQQQRKIKTQPGFFAAMDQSGGSTPKALRTYGIKDFIAEHELPPLLDAAEKIGLDILWVNIGHCYTILEVISSMQMEP